MARSSRSVQRLHGSIPALITPMKQGKVDFAAFSRFVEWQIDSGSHGLVPCGTTGETPTLTMDEHIKLIRTCVEAADGRVPVIAGTGSNNTEKAVELARGAEKSGADAILVVTPYYNKPTPEGIYQHYKAINNACGLPIILYNVPGRTGIEISVETVTRLASLSRVVGIKDASVDLSRPLSIRRALGPDFIQLSGEDATVGAYLGQGGHGCISVTANVAPALCAELHNSWEAGERVLFELYRDWLLTLHKNIFIETSPAPAKYCLSKMGFCRDELRLPLVPVSAASHKVLDKTLREIGMDRLGVPVARPKKKPKRK